MMSHSGFTGLDRLGRENCLAWRFKSEVGIKLEGLNWSEAERGLKRKKTQTMGHWQKKWVKFRPWCWGSLITHASKNVRTGLCHSPSDLLGDLIYSFDPRFIYHWYWAGKEIDWKAPAWKQMDSSLLGSIEAFKKGKLKKAVTNDRSGPVLDART